MKQNTRAKEQQAAEKGMSGMTDGSSTIHPTLLVIVRKETVRMMVDTGPTSYVCTNLITKLGIKPVRREQRCIEQMYGKKKKTIEVYIVGTPPPPMPPPPTINKRGQG